MPRDRLSHQDSQEAQGGWTVFSPKGKPAVHILNSAPPPNCTMWLLVVGGGLLSGVEEENHQPGYHLLIALYPLVFFFLIIEVYLNFNIILGLHVQHSGWIFL